MKMPMGKSMPMKSMHSDKAMSKGQGCNIPKPKAGGSGPKKPSAKVL